MNGATVTLQRAGDDRSLSYVETLLERNDLPSQDVRSKPECFYVASDGDGQVGTDRDQRVVGNNKLVGIGGVERYGTDGLLRSVVVDRSVRGGGFGTAICDALERRAQSEGVEALYLLTTTATDFFTDRGYVKIERDEAPASIQGTSEFADLCPTTATCMTKSL